ncbi:MAG: lysozyme [Nitrososphaera sp.]
MEGTHLLSDRGLELIRSFEGCKLSAYRDSGGVLTIGYGHTGADVKPGQMITDERATALLRADVARFETAVNDAAKVPLTQGQFDALVCFSFNVGAAALRKSILLRLVNVGDFAGAALQFQRWNKAGGKVLAGLIRRRTAERALFEGRGRPQGILILA